MFRNIALIAAVAAYASASAAPALGAKPAGPASPSPARQCFYTRMVDGFAAPDDQNLYVRVGVKDVYHFTLMTHCPDLDWNQRVALVARSGGFICDALDAEVVSHATGLGPQRCPVQSMEKLTPEQVAALPKRAKP